GELELGVHAARRHLARIDPYREIGAVGERGAEEQAHGQGGREGGAHKTSRVLPWQRGAIFRANGPARQRVLPCPSCPSRCIAAVACAVPCATRCRAPRPIPATATAAAAASPPVRRWCRGRPSRAPASASCRARSPSGTPRRASGAAFAPPAAAPSPTATRRARPRSTSRSPPSLTPTASPPPPPPPSPPPR